MNGLIIESEAYRTGAICRKGTPAINMLKDSQNNIRAYLTKLKLDPQSGGINLLSTPNQLLDDGFNHKYIYLTALKFHLCSVSIYQFFHHSQP